MGVCRWQGPKDTPYTGGTFELAINVPEHYPLQPPAVRYKTKCFHPNVHFKVRAAVRMAWCGMAGRAAATAPLGVLPCSSVDTTPPPLARLRLPPQPGLPHGAAVASAAPPTQPHPTPS